MPREKPPPGSRSFWIREQINFPQTQLPPLGSPATAHATGTGLGKVCGAGGEDGAAVRTRLSRQRGDDRCGDGRAPGPSAAHRPFHRITECSGLEGTSVGHPVQPPCLQPPARAVLGFRKTLVPRIHSQGMVIPRCRAWRSTELAGVKAALLAQPTFGNPDQRPLHPGDARGDVPAPGAGSATGGGKTPVHRIPPPGWVPALWKRATRLAPRAWAQLSLPPHGARQQTELRWALGQPQPLRSA